jgi:hypothetical protein
VRKIGVIGCRKFGKSSPLIFRDPNRPIYSCVPRLRKRSSGKVPTLVVYPTTILPETFGGTGKRRFFTHGTVVPVPSCNQIPGKRVIPSAEKGMKSTTDIRDG